MKKLLLFLILSCSFLNVFSQNTNLPKIMVIPFTKDGEDLRTILDDDINTRIMNGYEIIKKKLEKLENEKKLEDFFNYLKQKVQILRVEVPQDTDLNHYFEIMNNRGEQLEKH